MLDQIYDQAKECQTPKRKQKTPIRLDLTYPSLSLASAGSSTFVVSRSFISTVVVRFTSFSRSPAVIFPFTLNSYLASAPSFNQNLIEPLGSETLGGS